MSHAMSHAMSPDGRIMALDPPRERLMDGAAAGRAMDVLDRRLAGPMRQVQAGDKRADAIVLRDCEPIMRRAEPAAPTSGWRTSCRRRW